MRHRKKLPKLNRPADQRKALMRSVGGSAVVIHRCDQGGQRADLPPSLLAAMTRALVDLQTKAKAVRKYVDKMIQLAKDGSLHARRQVGTIASVRTSSMLRGVPALTSCSRTSSKATQCTAQSSPGRSHLPIDTTGHPARTASHHSDNQQMLPHCATHCTLQCMPPQPNVHPMHFRTMKP
jgi:ribosomal protein L17